MVNNKITLGPGNVSWDEKLGAYYQDIKEAISHFDNNNLGKIDEHGIPYLIIDGKIIYSSVYVIQYALISHDIYLSKSRDDGELLIIQKCMNWLDSKAESFKDSLVWRSEFNAQYQLEKGWVSAMYEGQAISLYLRAFQLFGNPIYLEKAKLIYNFFKYDINEGGAKRYDENGNVWLEEYPTEKGSYVLNGHIYALFGILDYFRINRDPEVKAFFEKCLESIVKNLPKYDRWYWSVYDRENKQLVSYYYQKNVHIPLMEILYKLTANEVFKKYSQRWRKQLNNPFNKLLVPIMYRIQPRVNKIIG